MLKLDRFFFAYKFNIDCYFFLFNTELEFHATTMQQRSPVEKDAGVPVWRCRAGLGKEGQNPLILLQPGNNNQNKRRDRQFV